MYAFISFVSTNYRIVTAWTAIGALFLSMFTIGIAIANMRIQRAHNRRSVLPIAHFSVGDYENEIFVRLRNDGVGPMIIEKVTVEKGREAEQTKSAIIQFMPDLPSNYFWSTFVEDIFGRAISAEKRIILVSLEGDQEDKGFIAARQMIRKALSDLTIKVEYKNIYGEEMPPVSRSLRWFGRHLEKAGFSPDLSSS